jgi:chromosome segregation ATPase
LDREEAPVVPAASKATSENHPADVVPAKETSPAGSSEAAGNSAGQFALLEAERQRLEHFIQQQLDNLREARQGLLAEKQANEQALETRRQELEHQGQLLMTRLKELHEREQQQADRIDDALPERHANYRRRRFSSLIDKSKITEEPDPEIKALRERLQESQQILVLAQGERDAAWDELATLRSQARQMENTIAERDAALAKWQQSHAKPESSPSPEADPIRLKRQAEEIETLWRQVQEQRQLLERVRKDHDAAREALVQEWQRKLEQLKAERDAKKTTGWPKSRRRPGHSRRKNTPP